MGQAEQILWLLNLVLVLLLAAMLTWRRLHRVYRWFFLLVCFQAMQTVGMLPLDASSDVYAWAYFCTQPILWILFILVVLELYSLALRAHPGIASLSRWVLTASVAMAVAVAALTLSADLSRPAGQYPILVYFGVIERGLMFSLVIFLLLITAFLFWTPIPIRRNIVLHASLFSAYFLAAAAGLFLRNVLGYHLVGAVSMALLVVNNICLLLWILFLNRRGEETSLVVRRWWRRTDEDRLTQQLDAVNSFLLRSAGKQGPG